MGTTRGQRWPKAPPTAAPAARRIDRELDRWCARASAAGWCPLPLATAERELDAAVPLFAAQLRGEPGAAARQERDPPSRRVFASLAAAPPDDAAALRGLFRDLVLAALYPAPPLTPEARARWTARLRNDADS